MAKKSIGVGSLVFLYVAACIAVSLIAYWRMGESSKTSHIEAELISGNKTASTNSSTDTKALLDRVNNVGICFNSKIS